MAQLKATLTFAKKLAEAGVIKGVSSQGLNKALFPLSKYLKYGLLSDDLMKENELIKEALRRLPADVYQERQYRLARAINLSSGKSVLPESEWTKPEQDVSYLKPFIEQVVNEQKEREDWNAGRFQ
ncbi:cytochrome b-c1 complex subunit 7 [Brachionus plicatilis]|uniref:Cytochrome b-c1 complex subunit 7 n=1 Tax=Brachionus plicatilis TaxID=10195 RepID=A0A3M7RFI1_BRAPC|nr:cytochrome b-c1 complex subunit 7 [Brachionus plicatilis]